MFDTTFALISRPSLIFTVVRFIEIAGIACVVGHTLDGKRQTVARVADVIFA